MDRMLPLRTLAALLLLGLATPAGAMPVNLRVVDQNGQELTGSMVTLLGWSGCGRPGRASRRLWRPAPPRR